MFSREFIELSQSEMHEKDATVTQVFFKDYFHVVLALRDGTHNSVRMMPVATGTSMHTHTHAHGPWSIFSCWQNAAVVPRSKETEKKKTKKA